MKPSLFVIVLAACLWACGPAQELDATGGGQEVAVGPACGPDTCSGCCDGYGQCQPSGDTHCGLNGVACLECLGQSYCGEAGACVAGAAAFVPPQQPTMADKPDTGRYMDESDKLCGYPAGRTCL